MDAARGPVAVIRDHTDKSRLGVGPSATDDGTRFPQIATSSGYARHSRNRCVSRAQGTRRRHASDPPVAVDTSERFVLHAEEHDGCQSVGCPSGIHGHGGEIGQVSSETERSISGAPPLPLPSVTSIAGQACFHSFVALSLVFASAMLWAATFGELPMFVKPPTHCVQYDFGPAGSADRLSR